MPDIIEIKTETPYLRANYDYIVDRMEEEGWDALVYSQREALDIGKNIVRRGLRFKMSKQGVASWLVKIRTSEDAKPDNNGRITLLMEGKELVLESQGQIAALRKLYQEKFPDHKKIRSRLRKDGTGFTVWLE